MKIFFDDGTNINVTLYDNVLKEYAQRCFKHLQHVDVPFRKRDGIEFLLTTTVNEQVEVLNNFGNKLGVIVDQQKCLSLDQFYLNFLHQVYEENYNGNPIWLDFHETIHILEQFSTGEIYKKQLNIKYRESGGLLEQKFQEHYKSKFVTQLKCGQLFLSWGELGKTPWDYWQNQEPDNITRICELAKPWINLKPQFFVCLSDTDLLKNHRKHLDKFLSWWEPYKKDWCAHWNIQNWSWQDMFSVIPIGQVENLNELADAMHRGAAIKCLQLDDEYQREENLSVELYITTTWDTHPPSLEILIDNNSVLLPTLTYGANHIKFNITLSFGTHSLKIIRSGATSDDNSQLVTIDNICIDMFDCEKLVLANSTFRPIYPEPWASQQRKQNVELLETIPYETVLGHNGEWELPFTSPVYPHLLEFNSSLLQF